MADDGCCCDEELQSEETASAKLREVLKQKGIERAERRAAEKAAQEALLEGAVAAAAAAKAAAAIPRPTRKRKGEETAEGAPPAGKASLRSVFAFV